MRYRIVRHGVGLDSVLVQCFIALMVAAMCGHYDTVRTLFFLARASRRRSCAAAVDARCTKHWLLVPRPQRRDGVTALCVASRRCWATSTSCARWWRRRRRTRGGDTASSSDARSGRCGDGTAGQWRCDSERAGVRRQHRGDVGGGSQAARVRSWVHGRTRICAWSGRL